MRLYVVGAVEMISQGVVALLERAGFEVSSFFSSDELLGSIRTSDLGCVLLGLSPGELKVCVTLDILAVKHPGMVTLVVSKEADIPLAVQCMKRGAIDFVVDAGDPSVIVERVRDAMASVGTRQKGAVEQAQMRERLSRLTHRERELVGLICNGLSNKQIAAQLSISTKTVENHRARLMHKTQAVNTADMVRLAITSELLDRGKKQGLMDLEPAGA